ncbi:MAG TPA: hypothetical protein DCZ95_05405 [Verrucomicrobia bacterium]|nr:MAG: hypothetical protein A2X46_10300 [Lentisphaerae bacterium GWF2_57_35]HBA83515.1 hypothetical protein [Verrucomicrobiota bacterium]
MGASSAKVSWWDDSVLDDTASVWEVRAANRKNEQAELWNREARPVVKAEPQGMAVSEIKPVAFTARFEEKKEKMSMLDRAKFLRISQSLYDGKEKGRWFNLPQPKDNCLRSQMTNTNGCKVDTSRTHRSAPRFSGTVGRQRANGFLFS